MNFLTIFFTVLGFIILSAILIAIYKVKHKVHYTGNINSNNEHCNNADDTNIYTDPCYSDLPGNIYHDNH